MGDLSFEVRGQVDDVNGAKGTFFRADTTADAQTLRDVCNLGFRGDFDTELSRSDHRAGFLAFLSTFLRPCQCLCSRAPAWFVVRSPLACTVKHQIT